MNIIIKTLIFCFFIFASFLGFSQEKTVEKNMQVLNGVEFRYQWKSGNCFLKKMPLQLRLEVENTNTYSIAVKFQLNYYQSGILKEQSDTISLCINPMQIKKGSKNGLNFSAGNFSEEDINSPSFTYEVNPIQIIKMRSCQENK
ncbi:MAG: hypothetical protein ACOYO1_06570 [Bacteroidales bacterium]